MKKPANEAELVKGAVAAGVKYAEERGAVVFETHDSQADKILYIYREFSGSVLNLTRVCGPRRDQVR